MEKNHQQVLSFWFGDQPDNQQTPACQSRLWWSKQEAVDTQIKAQFEPLLKAMVAGECRDWLASARGRLAAIVVLDQFSRNIYRDTPRAFSQDQLALHWCLDGIELGHDQKLLAIERVFFYLPLEHAESLEMLDLAVEKIGALERLVEEGAQGAFRDFHRYAIAHREVVEQFGRYPHRNKILGRESTAAEVEYLAKPGSGF